MGHVILLIRKDGGKALSATIIAVGNYMVGAA
jgi:hypothetical protein